MAWLIRLTEKTAASGEKPHDVLVNLDQVSYIRRSTYRKGADVVMISGRVIEVEERMDEICEEIETEI